MPTSWHLCPTLDTQGALRKGTRSRSIFGEEGHCHWNLDALPRFEGRSVAFLVVEANRGIDRLGHPIDHDVGKQCIFRILTLKSTIDVAPTIEFFDDPGSEPDRRIREAIGQRLWLG